MEKQHVEDCEELPVSSGSSDVKLEDYDEAHEKALLRKVDLRLLPILGALYSIALIDRVNISNARVAGMGKELNLQIGSRYSIALLVFFIPYIFFELPSNIVLRRVGSANWLGFIGFSWGIVILGQGFVRSYEALVACRTLLGFFEAGFFPGCVYLISCWYVRYEVQKRLAAFYLLSVFIGGFANILAYGLMHMGSLGKIGGMPMGGWRWIFIIEGLITISISVLGWFIIIDFPDKAASKGKFISHQDAKYMEARIENDRGDAAPDSLSWGKLFGHLTDWKLWVFALMFMSSALTGYAFAYFNPVIIEGMGFTAGQAQLLSAPPNVCAVFVAFFFAYLGDKYRTRGIIIAAQSTICFIGLMLAAYGKHQGVRYLGIILGTCAAHGNVPAILSYQANNIRMSSKRAVGSALQIGFSAIGGIMASTVFRQKDFPKYVNGLWASAGAQLFILAMLIPTTLYFWSKNKQVDEQKLEKPIEGHAGFKYTL